MAVRKFDFGSIFLAILLLAIFVFSAFVYFIKTPGKRYVFTFESVDSGKSAIEYRILPNREGDEAISAFVDELLLGPKTERSRPIFSPGTKQIFCFLRQKTLYVNLTSELLYKTGNAGEIMAGIDLFKKNIRRAFPRVNDIELYIDGISLFEEIHKN